MMAMGTVYLVGAGPGDPGLLTLRGREWLEQADVVLYDGLVDESLLRLCPQAELINVSKRPGAERLTQADLNALLVEQARRHGRVVRLKGGDPFLFGRGGEEAEHLAAHGVPFEVAPGVTAGIAAPAYAGIPVTHRDMASSVTFVTGHRDPDEQGELRIARNIPAEGAVVVYMAVGNLDQVVEALYEAGRAGDTPAAMVEWGATPKQRTVTGTLATIGAAAREHEVRPPAVLIAGEVVRLREHIAWYEQRPLVGKRIVVTRSEGRDSRLGDRLTALGAEVLAFPTIAVSPVDPPADVLPLGTYDWLVLTSVNGSRAILDLLDVHGLDARALAGVRICVLGEATALPLKERGLRPDLMATQQSSQDVARTLLAADPDLAGKRGVRMGGVSDDAADGVAGAVRRLAGVRPEPGGVHECVDGTQPERDPRTGADGSAPCDGVVGGDRPFDGAGGAGRGDDGGGAAGDAYVAGAGGCDRGLGDGRFGPLTAKTEEEMLKMTERLTRTRRMRRNETLRRMVRETRLSADHLVMPLFVRPGKGERRPIASMPGQCQLSVDLLVEEAQATAEAGVPAVLLFGIPGKRDALGSEAYAADAIVCQAVTEIKRACPDLCVITDVCLCEYTSHGHCGVVRENRDGRPDVDNDATLELLVCEALAHAKAGADIVAPSDMMDGRVGAIRRGLDADGLTDVAVLAYSAKFASAFYGPFRQAAESAPQFGDRRSYQMDAANGREALREIAIDIEEGADMVMVKPGLAYLDVLYAAAQRFDVPVAAYQVSGEYAMVKAAAAQGWLDEKAVALESLLAFRRAGASLVLTYWAREAAGWLRAG